MILLICAVPCKLDFKSSNNWDRVVYRATNLVTSFCTIWELLGWRMRIMSYFCWDDPTPSRLVGNFWRTESDWVLGCNTVRSRFCMSIDDDGTGSAMERLDGRSWLKTGIGLPPNCLGTRFKLSIQSVGSINGAGYPLDGILGESVWTLKSLEEIVVDCNLCIAGTRGCDENEGGARPTATGFFFEDGTTRDLLSPDTASSIKDQSEIISSDISEFCIIAFWITIFNLDITTGCTTFWPSSHTIFNLVNEIYQDLHQLPQGALCQLLLDMDIHGPK